jgi:hypothetical protein
MITPRLRALVLALLVFVALATPAPAADGEMRWGLHVTLAAKWLDPAETEAFNTPYMVMYMIHGAGVKPLPGGLNSPPTTSSCTRSRRSSGTRR